MSIDQSEFPSISHRHHLGITHLQLPLENFGQGSEGGLSEVFQIGTPSIHFITGACIVSVALKMPSFKSGPSVSVTLASDVKYGLSEIFCIGSTREKATWSWQ